MLNLERNKTDLNLDSWLGGLLLVSSALGIVCNGTAFTYFKQVSPRNSNREYFRRLYMIINVTDILIGLSAFPSIEALFTENRMGSLLTSPMFCNVWMVWWWVLCQTSVFLVATLSLSRLTILKNKDFRFCPGLAVVVPTGFAMSIIGMFIVSFACEFMYTTYVPEYVVCSFIAFKDNLTQPVTPAILTTVVVTLGMFNVTTSLCFLLICASFITTLCYLRRSAQVSAVINSSARHHVKAARSVIMLTLLYLVFNTPFMVVMVCLVMKMLVNSPENSQYTTGDLVRDFFSEPFGKKSTFANEYVIAITNMIFVCLNSAINPLAYYLRIDGFKTYIWKNVYMILSNRRNANKVKPNLNSMGMKSDVNSVVRKSSATSANHHHMTYL